MKKIVLSLMAAAMAVVGMAVVDLSTRVVEASQSVQEKKGLPDLEVRFGREGEAYVLSLEDNDTAAGLVDTLSEAPMNLPVYHFDDFEHCDVMQYYDIPDSYSFKSSPLKVERESAGEIYYSDPNRIILFYRDAEISGEYTKIGTFQVTEGLAAAVTENPVIEGWDTKIVAVSIKR